MKKFISLISLIMCLVMCTSSICVYAYGYTTLYTADGRSGVFKQSEVEAQLKVGWYTEPVQTLYTADGRTKIFKKSEVAAQLKVGWFATKPVKVYAEDGRTKYIESTAVAANEAVGWYTTPVQTLYAADGRTKVFKQSEVAAQVSVGWSTEPFVTMYAADGRTKKVKKSQVAANQKVGWFATKPVKMYAEGGKTKYVESTDVAANEAVGWYTEPVQRLYALGKSKVFKKSQVAAQIKVGWFTEPVTEMYAIDGRTKAVPNSQIAANKKVGWYLINDYVIARANVIKKNVGYEPAINFVESMYYHSATNFSTLYDKKKSLCKEWYNNIGCPVAVTNSSVSTSSYPKAYVYFRNISTKAVVAIEYTFTCHDVYGDLTSDGSAYSKTITVNYDKSDLYISPTYENWISTTLYNNDKTRSIKNITVKKVAFSDGTVWKR